MFRTDMIGERRGRGNLSPDITEKGAFTPKFRAVAIFGRMTAVAVV